MWNEHSKVKYTALQRFADCFGSSQWWGNEDTNEKQEQLHHQFNGVSYSSLIGQLMFIRLSNNVQSDKICFQTYNTCVQVS